MGRGGGNIIKKRLMSFAFGKTRKYEGELTNAKHLTIS